MKYYNTIFGKVFVETQADADAFVLSESKRIALERIKKGFVFEPYPDDILKEAKDKTKVSATVEKIKTDAGVTEDDIITDLEKIKDKNTDAYIKLKKYTALVESATTLEQVDQALLDAGV